MKTVQKGTEIKRVKEDEAELMVKNRGYKYVAKSVWKDAVRPAKKEEKKTDEASV